MSGGYRSRVRLSLSQTEARALAQLIGHARAGDLYETFHRDTILVAATARVHRRLGEARTAAVQRDIDREQRRPRP